jgi:hypothetical protein
MTICGLTRAFGLRAQPLLQNLRDTISKPDRLDHTHLTGSHRTLTPAPYSGGRFGCASMAEARECDGKSLIVGPMLVRAAAMPGAFTWPAG